MILLFYIGLVLGIPLTCFAQVPAPPTSPALATIDWIQVTRALEADPLFSIGTAASDIAQMLARDEAFAFADDIKAAWGTSINFDEFAQAQIVRPEVLESIGKLAHEVILQKSFVGTDGISRWAVHAGLEHTYGYLFSNLITPFGYKRARWIDHTVENGLGLKTPLLDVQSRSTTLFANVTSLLGKIAFRSDAAALKKLEPLDTSGMTSPEVANFSLSGRGVVTLKESTGGRTLRTDIVLFSDPSEGGLLVYSLVSALGARLISGFPVDAAFVQKVSDPKSLGALQPIKAQYNLYLDPPATSGSRTLTVETFP